MKKFTKEKWDVFTAVILGVMCLLTGLSDLISNGDLHAMRGQPLWVSVAWIVAGILFLIGAASITYGYPRLMRVCVILAMLAWTAIVPVLIWSLYLNVCKLFGWA